MAWLKRAGLAAAGRDLAIGRISDADIRKARLIGISAPMHTALSLGRRFAQRARGVNPAARICFFGLYAHLLSETLLESAADFTIGGEYEKAFAALAGDILAGGSGEIAGVSRKGKPRGPILEALDHPVADRAAFGGPAQYAMLDYGGKRLAAYVEASRGCKHVCAHCPVTPVYGGRFFTVPLENVLEDARRQVELGAEHVSFGDPDFLNGPAHAVRVVEALGRRFPEVTFDFTAKVEHLLKHADLLEGFSRRGCLFVVSAVESLSDVVLRRLKKGHTREDVRELCRVMRRAGLTLRPSLVSFTPWTTLEDFLDVLDWVEEEGMIRQVDPVHYAIRLLVPPGSPLAQDPCMREHLGELDAEGLSLAWRHPDARMDALAEDVMACAAGKEDAAWTFARIRELARAAKEGRAPSDAFEVPALKGEAPARMTESWFCCAEPTASQFGRV